MTARDLVPMHVNLFPVPPVTIRPQHGLFPTERVLYATLLPSLDASREIPCLVEGLEGILRREMDHGTLVSPSVPACAMADGVCTSSQ